MKLLLLFSYKIRYHELVAIHGELSPLVELVLRPVDTARIRLVANRVFLNEMDMDLRLTVEELKVG